MNTQWKPVRNYTSGRFGYRPEAIVIHIAEGTLEGAYSWFNNPSSQASAHYMVAKDGEIWQFVADNNTAWHAGGVNRPSWQGLKPGVNPNYYTIGIEHEGRTGEPWTEEMYESSAWLLAQISLNWGLELNRQSVIGHYQINSVTRLRCPGSGVDLDRLINLAINNYLEDPEMIKELEEKIKKLENEINICNNKFKLAQEQREKLEVQNRELRNRVKTLESIIKKFEESPKEPERLRIENSKLRVEVDRVQELEEELSRLKNKKENQDSFIDRIIDSLFG